MDKRNLISIFITLGGNLESIGKHHRKKYFNSLSQMGASLSQMTRLPERTHETEDSPMSWYLEAKNNKCHILNSQVIFLLELLLSRDYSFGEFRKTNSICQNTVYCFLKFYVCIWTLKLYSLQPSKLDEISLLYKLEAHLNNTFVIKSEPKEI